MDAPNPKAAEGGPEDYWPSFIGPLRPAIPFILGCSIPVAIVTFLSLFHLGKEPLDALHFTLSTLVGSLIGTLVMVVLSATVYVLFHPRYGFFKKLLLVLLLRLPVAVVGLAWLFIGMKREWFGSFTLSWPPLDGAADALVTLSDLAAGFAAVPLGLGIYHRRWLHEKYCNADPRTLGILRIALGTLLTADAIRHWKEARWFYANTGVLTNHYLLFKPFSGYNFSLWNAFSSLPEVHVIFAIATLVNFLLLIGYRTRLFSILAFVLVTSQDNRLVMVENGGYVVVNLLTGWAMFMPLGRRFSVDALLRSYREHKEKTWEDLNRRFRPADKYELEVSGIYLLAIVNLAIVYFYNVVNKSGHIWKSGYTVHYVLHLDRMVTGIAVFFRENMPMWISRAISWTVLAVEALICTWIISPYGRRYTRPLAMFFMTTLHGLFGLMFRLGPFSWFLIGWSFMLPRPESWADLETWQRRKAAPRTVVLDRSSPLAFALGRLLARLDGLDLLTFEPSPEGESAPALVLVKSADGRSFTGREAFREIAQALPGGRFFRIALLLLTLGTLGPILDFLARRRAGVARFFGLGLAARGESEAPVPSPVRARLAGIRVTARETFIAYLATCAFFQMMSENKCFPPQLKPKLPSYMAAMVSYPRMFQGWGMFAANPITDDGSVSVDAITVTGRHVDPFTGEAPDLDLTDARGLGLNQLWQDYFNRIRLERNKTYRPGMKDYFLHWHEQTGNPDDELVAFDVYWLRDQCPKPGESKPYQHEKIALLTYRKPGYKPPKGLLPLPPEPKVGNAEKSATEPQRENPAAAGQPGDGPAPQEKRGSGDVGR